LLHERLFDGRLFDGRTDWLCDGQYDRLFDGRYDWL
jgi:hypothetical protein